MQDGYSPGSLTLAASADATSGADGRRSRFRCGIEAIAQWPMLTGPPSLTLRSVSASGTAASAISIKTQKASI
jgi:hypothetical protein